jgi:hypothetical protein
LRVIYTRHFLKRCYQQELSPGEIRKRMMEIPKTKGDFIWRLDEGTEVVCRQVGNQLLLITVIGMKKRMKTLRKIRGRTRKNED